jgi:hypothetical protein
MSVTKIMEKKLVTLGVTLIPFFKVENPALVSPIAHECHPKNGKKKIGDTGCDTTPFFKVSETQMVV